MKRLLLAAILAVFTASPAVTQVVPPTQGDGPSVATGSVPLTYTGGDSRVSVGVDQDGNSQGELMQVFGNNGEHAIVGQFWWGHGGAGGIQADYNWLFGNTLEQAQRDPDSITVAKLSFAIDQNSEKDRQANIGLAIERKEFFLNFFLSGGVGGSRNAGALTSTQQSIQSGTDQIGNYTQTVSELTTTLLEAQPYSYTVGVHGGHFSDPLAARFNGGIDYAKGQQGASETRFSIGVDKYLGVRGWSLSATAEHSQQHNPVESTHNDNRASLFLRYEFGGSGAFAPTSQVGDTAWIQRALHEPVIGHPRTVDTYVTRGKKTTTATQGPRHYTAKRPIARDDTASVAQNSSNNAIDVLANDTDPDGNPLSVSSVTSPGNGTAQISANHLNYTPAPGFSGTDQFDYTVSNSQGLSATAKVTVTVNSAPPLQRPPIARDDAAMTPYATPVTVSVLANDSDPNGYPLTVTAVTAPAHGAAQVNPDGTVTYVPGPTYAGSDGFTYTISNGHGGTATAKVTLTVKPPTGLLVARDDEVSTAYNTARRLAVLANDSAPPGLVLKVESVTQPSHGSAQIGSAGFVVYTPAAGFVGTDNFTYTASDGFETATANVTVTVLPAGSPTPQDDTASTPFNTPVTIAVLANDSDPQGFKLTVESTTTPAHGSTTVNPNGTVTYTPQPTFAGNDAFSYTVSNGHGGTASATVTVTVQQPPPPVARPDTATTPFNKPVSIAVLANDSSPVNLPLSVTQTTQPANGTAAIGSNGSITYAPHSTFSGSDSFSYTISDGYHSASSNVTVTVQPPLPPVAVADSASTPFGTVVKISVLANDSDPNGLPLTVTAVTQPSIATVLPTINSDGTISYTPNAELSGVDTFSYTISNGYLSASAVVTVTVQAPLPPVARNDSMLIPFNTATEIPVLANDSDPQNFGLIITQITAQPAHGTATIDNLNGTITYTPGMALPPFGTALEPYVGPDSFTYQISNGFNTATATVNVTVQLPPPPIANNDTASCNSGSGVAIDVLGNDIPQFGLPLTVTGVSPPTGGGSVVLSGNNTIIYTDNVDSGPRTDAFTYTIADPYGQPSTATVTVTILN